MIARYGNRRCEAPAYDLEALRASIDPRDGARGGMGRATRWCIERPGSPPPPLGSSRGSVLDATGFRYVRRTSGGPLRAGCAASSTRQCSRTAAGPQARFSDVRVLDAGNRQIPYLVERRDEPLEVRSTLATTVDAKAAELQTVPGQHVRSTRSRCRTIGLPTSTLVLDTSARVFQRSVQVGFERPPDRRHRDAWFDVHSTSVWQHVDQQTAAPALSVRSKGTIGRELLRRRRRG